MSSVSTSVVSIGSGGFSRKQFLFLVSLLLILGAFAGCKSGSSDQRFIDRGKDLVAKKEYARALIEFRNAARLKPKSAEPYYQTGLAYLGMGDYRMAYQNLLQATQMDPKHVAAQNKLAEVIGTSVTTTQDTDQLKAAEKRVQSVLAVVPDSSAALSALGATEYQLGKSEDAVKHLQAALEKFPQNLQAARALALIKINQKDFLGAEQILRKAATDSPKSPEAQVALARMLLVAQRPADGETAYRQALTIDPQNAAALLDLAKLQLATGKKEEAEKTLVLLSSLPDPQYKALHAIYLFEQGRQDEAIKEFEKQAAANPNDRDAFSRLTSAYFFARRFPDAERAVNAALKRNAKDTNALLDRSKLYLLTAKVSEAEGDLNQVLRYDPNSAAAYYLLSRVFAARGQDAQARQQLSKALEFDPTFLAARIDLAQSLTASGGAKAALDLLDQTPDYQKNALPVLVGKNWAFVAVGDQGSARKGINDGLAKYDHAPDLVWQDGVLKFQAKDMLGARKSFQEVMAARPEDAVALDALAKTFVFEKRPELALQAIEQYVARQPNSAPLQTVLGDWMSRNKRPDAARKAFAAAIAADPSLVKPRMSLALMDVADGKFDSARQELNALAAGSRSPAVLADVEVTLGMIEQKAGNDSAAILHYRKTLEFNPKNVVALNNLAYLLANSTNQIDEALRYAQQVKELEPDSLAIEDTIGWVFYRKGIYDTAVVHLQNSVAKEPTAVRKYHLAMAYLKAGDRPLGRKTLAEALKMDPNLPEAAAARQLADSSGVAK